MARGDKSAYTDKQKRQAEHIEDSEKKQGRSTDDAEQIAWATVNKQDGGGKKKAASKSDAKSKSDSKGKSDNSTKSTKAKSEKTKTEKSKHGGGSPNARCAAMNQDRAARAPFGMLEQVRPDRHKGFQQDSAFYQGEALWNKQYIVLMGNHIFGIAAALYQGTHFIACLKCADPPV